MDDLLDGLMELARGSRRVRSSRARRPRRVVRAPRRRRGGRVALHLDLGRPARAATPAARAARGEPDRERRSATTTPAGASRAHRASTTARRCWSVANSGPRLDPRGVGRLLEPFERGGRARDGRGAGLGLSIVRAVAEAHGGAVALRRARGRRPRRRVALPRATALRRSRPRGAVGRGTGSRRTSDAPAGRRRARAGSPRRHALTASVNSAMPATTTATATARPRTDTRVMRWQSIALSSSAPELRPAGGTTAAKAAAAEQQHERAARERGGDLAVLALRRDLRAEPLVDLAAARRPAAP